MASGVAVGSKHEAELNALAADRVRLTDERRRLEARLSSPPAEPGPHDHLRHRHQPLEPETHARLRLLSGWSAVSTPLLLGVLGLVFLPDRPAAIMTTVALWTVVVLGIEAAARRHFTRYLMGVLVVVGVVLLVGAFALSTIAWGWRYAVTGTFWVLGLVLLVANVKELGRD